MQLHHRSAGYGTCCQGSHRFICYPLIYPRMEWTIPAFAFLAKAGPHLQTLDGWKAELACVVVYWTETSISSRHWRRPSQNNGPRWWTPYDKLEASVATNFEVCLRASSAWDSVRPPRRRSLAPAEVEVLGGAIWWETCQLSYSFAVELPQ